MKALKMILKDSCSGDILQKFIAQRFESTQIQTVINKVGAWSEPNTVRFPYSIDHTSMIEGMLTIYYSNGMELEVTRVYISELNGKQVTCAL